MKLLEYEAKALLRLHDIPTPRASIVTTPEDLFTLPAVLKSQVPVGGRGKAGGVALVKDGDEAKKATIRILSLPIKSHTPRVLLAEEPLSIKHEYYLALIINKSAGTIELMAHIDGGMEVEDQSGFAQWSINKSNIPIIADELAEYFTLINQQTAIAMLLKNLYECFTKNDTTLLEINPLVLTNEDELVAADCKMTLDDAARFRHPEWDFEDKPVNANFVTLNQNGAVATIANGAGLAMATVDAVADAGLVPANFLDVGGGANEASVLEAFNKIAEYPSVSAIVINIFAGITRCDEVAKAIISAQSKIPNLPKLYIRLAGTNYDKADALLKEANIPLLPSLVNCLEAIRKDNV